MKTAPDPGSPLLASPFLSRSPGMVPPFNFPGVTMRVFPLKADMYVLRAFCDKYLNVAPPEVAEFEPFAPFVYMIVLHYGKMSVEAANLGWISQHEVTFSVPLLWHRRRANGRETVDWAYVTPFIFVDNPLSLTTGREVYGWPKVLSHFQSDIDRWMRSPTNAQTLMSMSTLVVDQIGGVESEQVLLEIEDTLIPNTPLAPPAYKPLFRALTAAPRALLSSLSLASDLMSIWTAPPLLGYSPNDRRLLMQSLAQGFQSTLPLRGSPYYNIVTQKQFRDVQFPQTLCYQALVMSRMTLRRYNRGGLLGDFSYFQGDNSGGLRILVHRYATQTIVDILGLEVDQQMAVAGRAVDILMPIYPFWLDLDVEYGRGSTLCWRTRESAWHRGSEILPSAPAQPPGHLYNTAQGPTFVDIGGPQQSDDTTINILPLLASFERLQQVVDNYLNVAPDVRFEACGQYVYLVTMSFGQVTSSLDALGSIAGRELAFYIPVLQRGADGQEKRALLAPFIYADNSTVAVTGREVGGIPMMQAQLASPPDTWMRGPSGWRTLLQVTTLLFPVQDLGVEATQRVLLDIYEGNPEASVSPLRKPGAAAAGEALETELRQREELRPADPEDLVPGGDFFLEMLESRDSGWSRSSRSRTRGMRLAPPTRSS